MSMHGTFQIANPIHDSEFTCKCLLFHLARASLLLALFRPSLIPLSTG